MQMDQKLNKKTVKLKVCKYCGSIVKHTGKCPSVKSFEYYPDGKIKKVEFLTPVDYHQTTFTPVYTPQPPIYQPPYQPMTPYNPASYTIGMNDNKQLLNEGEKQ